MLAHCDLVLMAKSVKMRTPFPQLGLAPEAGSSFSFAERMGWQNASYALLSGKWFSAQECLDMGLAWRVEADEEVLASPWKWPKTRKNPIPSLIATKELMMMAGRQEASWSAHGRENEVRRSDGRACKQEAFKPLQRKETRFFKNIRYLKIFVNRSRLRILTYGSVGLFSTTGFFQRQRTIGSFSSVHKSRQIHSGSWCTG